MDLHAAVWTCMDLMHSCCYSAAITSLMCRVASVRPCRIRITPKSWIRKWPQVKLRSELTISEQCSENISHKHALTYKNKDRHYEWAHFSFFRYFYVWLVSVQPLPRNMHTMTIIRVIPRIYLEGALPPNGEQEGNM